MKLLRNAFQTPDGTVLISRSVHDYRDYTDDNGKRYFIDGGLSYSRRSAHEDQVDMCVWSDDDFEDIREGFSWGTYGKLGDKPLTYVKLKEMTNAHLEACLETQKNMAIQIRDVMEKELKYREENKVFVDED